MSTAKTTKVLISVMTMNESISGSSDFVKARRLVSLLKYWFLERTMFGLLNNLEVSKC